MLRWQSPVQESRRLFEAIDPRGLAMILRLGRDLAANPSGQCLHKEGRASLGQLGHEGAGGIIFSNRHAELGQDIPGIHLILDKVH
jgi:hypothetical protein